MDSACILRKGDHPVIRHNSFIDYRRAMVKSYREVTELIANKRMVYKGTAGPDLLCRLRRGAEESEHVREEAYMILYEQELVKPF